MARVQVEVFAMQRGGVRGSSPFTRRRRWRAEDAEAVLAKLDASGVDLVVFARQAGIDPARLKRWRRALSPSTAPTFEEVVRVPEASVPATRWFEVVLTSGRVVRVPESFDAGVLGKLLAVVEGGAAC
jgi:Transposase